MLIVSILPIMKNLAIALILTVTFGHAGAQYYYREIINVDQMKKDLSLLKEKKIRSIVLKSYEQNGEPSKGFFCEKKIAKDYEKTELFTRSNVSAASLLTSYFSADGKILRINDSSKISVTNTSYQYLPNGKISKVVTEIKSSDEDFTTEATEEHLYDYDENGHLYQMRKVKNGRDTVLIFFKTDDRGNVIIEKDSKTGSKYYYYYNDKHQLIDIALSTEFKIGLNPQFSFDYNFQGALTKMVTTQEGGGSYLTWKYVYDDGLRIAERCYFRGNQLVGSLEYEYKR